MDIDRLQTFKDVADCGSIAAAARMARCDPSIISRALAALESELGVRLFQRTTRRLRLTEAGVSYLRRIEPVLDELAAARDEALQSAQRPRGRIRVTASSAFGQTVIAPVLTSFRREYPDIELELLLTDTLLDIVGDRIDVALRSGPKPAGDFVVSRLLPTAMRAVASPAYLKAHLSVAKPADLSEHICLLSAPEPTVTWVFRKSTTETAVSVSGSISTSNTLVVRRCALDGVGIAVLADWLVDEDIAAGRLVHVLQPWKVAVRHFDTGVWIIYPSRSFLPIKTRTFIDHLRAHIGPKNTR